MVWLDGVVQRVRTPHGAVQTGTIICAAGAWSRACGAMAGVRLDVEPLRRQVLFTAPMPDLPAKLPLTIDFASGFYFHREGRGLLMGMADPDETRNLYTVPAHQAVRRQLEDRLLAWMARIGDPLLQPAPGVPRALQPMPPS